jgi:fluoride exporter
VERFLIVCGAGGLGCGTRYLISRWANTDTFPYGTLIVNIVGSFIIAFVADLALRKVASGWLTQNVALGITTGFLGGLTTYSAFNYESTRLLFGDQPVRGVLDIVVTLAACFGAGLLGLWVARRF